MTVSPAGSMMRRRVSQVADGILAAWRNNWRQASTTPLIVRVLSKVAVSGKVSGEPEIGLACQNLDCGASRARESRRGTCRPPIPAAAHASM